MRDSWDRVARAITHRVSRQGEVTVAAPAASCGADSGCRLAFVSCSPRPAWMPRPALIVFLVVGLVGHLWMQSSHTVQTAQGTRASAVRIATHAAGDQHHGQPAEHAPVCLALPSADHPALHDPLRCPTLTAPATVWGAGDGRLDIVRSQPPVHASSPRSPEHGVVLVL